MRVGILGGTFDPVHFGHLLIAEESRLSLALDYVLFIPAGQPWLKAGQPLTAAEHRWRMTLLATASNPHFHVLRTEIDRPGRSYTVDTLTELPAELGQPAELYFILGVDALASFHRWKEPERILQLANLVAVRRPGYRDTEIDIIINEIKTCYPDYAHRLTALSMPGVDFSATVIRRRAAAGQSFRYHTPEPVERYILEQGLYRPG